MRPRFSGALFFTDRLKYTKLAIEVECGIIYKVCLGTEKLAPIYSCQHLRARSAWFFHKKSPSEK
jgi:hypothetical protein